MKRGCRRALVLFDGTLWRDDEMIGRPRPQDRPAHGPYERVRPRRHDRRLPRHRGEAQDLVHINNTNPILLDGFGRSARLAKDGWEAAYDGMEISL